MKLDKSNFTILNLTLFGLYSVTQFLIILGLDAGFNPYDSPTYFEFNLTNPTRLPVITLIYSSLKYFDLIIIFQTILNIFSWIFCITSFQAIFKSNFEKITISVLLIILSLSTPILEQHTILMSESLTISLTILAMSSLVRYLYLKEIKYFLLFLVFILLYSGTKVSNSYISLLFLIFLMMYLLFININNKRIIIILIFIAIFPIYFFIDLGSKAKVTINLVSVTNIIERSFDDPNMRKWFIDKGFPAEAYNKYAIPNNEPPIENVMNLPQVKNWLNDQKFNIQILYLIKNPTFAFMAPIIPNNFIFGYTKFESIFPSISMGTINTNNTHLFSNLNAITMDRNPDYLRALKTNKFPFWGTDTKSFIFIPATLFFITFISYQFSSTNLLENNKNITVCLIAFILIGIWLNWHFTVNYDMQRFLMPYSVLLRVLFCFSVITIYSSLKSPIVKTAKKNF